MALPAGTGPLVPAETSGNLAVEVRPVPELGHQAVHVPRAHARVDRPAVRLAGHLQADCGKLFVDDLEEHVAVELPDGELEIVAELLFRRLVLRDGHLEPAEDRQVRERIVSAPRLELRAHVRGPRRPSGLVAVEQNELEAAPDLVADVLLHVADHLVHVERDGLRVHLVALDTKRLPLVGLREGAHRDVLHAHALHDGDLLKVRAAARDVRLLERPAFAHLHGECGVRGERYLRLGVRDVEHELAHRKTRGNPRAARRGVAGTVVYADLDAALLRLLAREAHELPPVGRERNQALVGAVLDLRRPRRADVRHAEDRRRADASLLEPVEVLDDSFFRDVAPHPVPPHARLSALRRVAEYRFRVRRGIRR